MGEHGVFQASPEAQSQSKPGKTYKSSLPAIRSVNLNRLSLESKLAFPSESSKLEGKGEFVMWARGKLEGKKALITGGEYDNPQKS